MNLKKAISTMLSGIMLMTSIGIIPVYAEGQPEELSRLTETTKVFDAIDYYTSSTSNTLSVSKNENGAGWTLPEEYSFDNDTYHFLGILAGDVTMNEGYGAESEWTAIQFVTVGNSNGDFAVYDIDGKAIFGDCYAAQYNRRGEKDGFYIGHGERNCTNDFAGTDAARINDGTTNRLKTYLKTEVTEKSKITTTGNFHYSDNPNDDICTIVMENTNGTVSELIDNVLNNADNAADTEKFNSEEKTYTGDYYTVKTYQNNDLISTEYYQGHFNGIKYWKHIGKNYYGNLKFYASAPEEPSPSPSTEPDEPGSSPSTKPEVTEKPSSSPTAEPADEDYTAYLFAYFRKEARDVEELCYGVSRDGYTFRKLNGGDTVLKSTLGTEHLRDPYIFRGEDNYFYIVVTDMDSTKGWASQSTIAIYKTKDLITMDDEILVDYSKFEGFEDCNRAWAPQVIWCPEHNNADGTTGAYMIYFAIQKASTAVDVGTVMYKSFATDLMDINTYTAPEMMLTGQAEGEYSGKEGTVNGAIDGDIIYDTINNRWLMYFDGFRVAACDTVDGMYTELSGDGEGIYNGTSPFADTRIEGSNIYKLLDEENKWLICADGQSFGTGFNVYETTDFTNYSKINLDTDFLPRHGYVIPITESELNKVMDKYGYVDLPDKYTDNPLTNNLTLPYTEFGYKIAGNITLPEKVTVDNEELSITWTSSDENIIKSKASALDGNYGENYTEYPAGKVTRPTDGDEKVTLTATVTKNGTEYTKNFVVTVKKAPAMSYAEMRAKDEQDGGVFTGYLYASFIEPAVTAQYQQVYFASSDDGKNWTDLNSNKPVLESTMGTKATRDHYIIRSAEGDRFYIIATDLDVTGGKWGDYGEKGSKYIMVWESDDLVNWSDQRMVKVADLDDTTDTGCVWAPEAIYDEITGEYIVYWSGTDIKEDSPNKGRKVVYYSKTRDFRTFTPQKQFVYPDETIDGVAANTSKTFIDTTMIEGSDGLFYRTTKYEETSPLHVFVDVAEYPLGEFKRIKTNLDEKQFLGTEGPGWFKYNKDDAETFNAKYCLMLDGYGNPNKGVGFFPNSIPDLNNTWQSVQDGTAKLEFTRINDAKMRSYAKHGGILPLTQEEYERVNEAYESIPQADLSAYINDKNKKFDAANYYTNKNSNTLASAAGWTLPSGYTFDNDTYHYYGFNGKTVMGAGYGNDAEWAAVQFDMAANSAGDAVIRDIDGNNITGYCYDTGAKGFWVGHGERSYGGDKKDSYGVNRFSNYLKTELGDGSQRLDTPMSTYAQHDICTIIIKNNNGEVDNYNGDYYTVETYINNQLLSTEYYKGKANGIGSIESNKKQYYGNLQIYAAQPAPIITPVDNKFKLFDIDFNNSTTEAKIGKATADGTITFGDGAQGGEDKAAYLDGASFLSLTKADGTPLLKGKDNIVVTMKAKLENNGNTGWYFFTAPNGNVPNGSYRYYVGLLNNYKNTVAERFRNNNKNVPTIQAGSTLGEWQDITLVIGEKTSELYIDGKSAGTADYDYKLSDILGDGNEQVTYIGKAPWVTKDKNEFAKGYFDDITVYDFAPILNIPNLTNVKTDIVLPTATAEKDGYSITWKSSNEDVISNTGKVTRPKTGKVNVRLTATISFDDTTLTKTYDALVKGEDYYDLKLDIHNQRDVEIQPDMYGLFFEDISYGADGGLYAELIQNRNFEELLHAKGTGTGTEKHRPLYKWSAENGTITAVTKKADNSVVEINKDGSEKGAYTGSYKPLNTKNPTYLKLNGTSFSNEGFTNNGKGGIYVESGKKYNISFYAMTGAYSGNIKAKVVKGNDTAFEATAVKTDDNAYAANGWIKYTVQATADKTLRNAKFVIELESAAEVYFDMISVMPDDAVAGVFRKDMFEMLDNLNPAFVRFPGGCVVEGFDIGNRYKWKDSVGPIEERKQNFNRWLDAGESGMSGYNQTLGLGFYEYFRLCEELNASAVPVLSVGIGCEYEDGRNGSFVPIYKDGTTEYTDEFKSLIDDAIDLIAFATSTDMTNEWAKLRVDMGHPEPFDLKGVGIGNEQGKVDPSWSEWYTRYELFEKEIHKVYPDIKLINNSGPFASGGYTEANWAWIREKQAQNDKFTYAVDEHFYMEPQWFLDNDNRYDNYPRHAKVFAGEYAANGTYGNTLYAAIAEAAFMTGMERNADVVYMSALAPLFCNYNCENWSPNMIWCDETASHTTPNYYVQQMYMQNNGSYTLKSDTASDEKAYQTASYDAKTGDIIVKIVNPQSYEQRVSLALDDSFGISGTADEIVLTGENMTDKNGFEEEKVKPVKNTINVTDGMDYAVPAYGFVVLRIHTEDGGFIAMTDFTKKGGNVSYKLTAGSDFDADEYDVYTAIYEENGVLASVFKNQMNGSAALDDDKEYEIKVMVWEKDTMKPASGYEPITETTMENSVYKLMSYTTTGAEHAGGAPASIGNSLHIAVSNDNGKTYEPLNFNTGVLYAEADYSAEGGNPYRGVSKMFRSPYLFKMENGKYGVIAARADETAETDLTDGKIMVYTSDDLTAFDFIGYLELDDKAIYEPKCVYENSVYTISWSNETGGDRKYATTTDFKTASTAKPSGDIYSAPSVSIKNATAATNVLNISKSTYDSLRTSLNAPVNTGIQEFEDVTVAVNGTPTLPERATATYNDGSTQDYNVEWNTSNLNTAVAGEYTVSGTVVTKDYPTNFIANRADPCMLKANGKYYFVATRDAGGQTVLNIRVADTVDGIATAEEHELFANGSDLIWAPEIHEVEGKLIILFATGAGWNHVQSNVMVLKDNGNATVKNDWSAPVRIAKQDGTTYLMDENGITLDMTAFKWNNKWYYSWSQRIVDTRAVTGTDYGFESANIYIAEFNPQDPTKIISDTAVIAKPVYGWERTTAEVDEGPFTIINDGKLYMTLSGNGTNTSYCIKLLTLSENGNPLEPSDWITKGYPILSNAMNTAEPGPGHSSFSYDENDDPVLVYHWGPRGGGRTTSIKNVHFNTKGEPVLNIPRGEQIKDEYKNVTIKVKVQ